TEAMAEMALSLNEDRIYDEATSTCNAPLVFKGRDGGYEIFRQYAVSLGRGAEWVAWSADEACPQANVVDDQEVAPSWTSFCSFADAIMDAPGGGGSSGGGAGPTGGPCNGVTWEGQCEGNTVVWCDDQV